MVRYRLRRDEIVTDTPVQKVAIEAIDRIDTTDATEMNSVPAVIGEVRDEHDQDGHRPRDDSYASCRDNATQIHANEGIAAAKADTIRTHSSGGEFAEQTRKRSHCARCGKDSAWFRVDPVPRTLQRSRRAATRARRSALAERVERHPSRHSRLP